VLAKTAAAVDLAVGGSCLMVVVAIALEAACLQDAVELSPPVEAACVAAVVEHSLREEAAAIALWES
jgi:hypothetical protein